MATDEKPVHSLLANAMSDSKEGTLLPVVNPTLEKLQSPTRRESVPAFFYVVSWIGISSAVILYNKWILDTLGFRFPVILTTYHLTVATVMTQCLARCTTLLDGRRKIKMTPDVYMRAIVPIGTTFSLSLIFGNMAYLYLSVAFIQMLKATTPVAVLISGWALGVASPDFKVFLNVSVIVVGVILASIGEIKFVLAGFLFQLGGVIFEALRLSLVQKVLSNEFKMDPLVSIYYYAPVCAVLNLVVALICEIPRVTMKDVYNVGFTNFFLNGMTAFALNFAAVSLIGKTSAVVLTLCGVLKDILLVMASMFIWDTKVSALQMFGYTIALTGIIYYKLGYDKMKGVMGEANRHWAELGVRRPILRQVTIIAISVFVILLMLGAVTSSPYSAAPPKPAVFERNEATSPLVVKDIF